MPRYMIPSYEGPGDDDDEREEVGGDDGGDDGDAAARTSDKGWWQIPTEPQSLVDPSPPIEPPPTRRRPIVGVVIAVALAAAVALVSVALVRLVSDADRETRGTGGAPNGAASGAASGAPGGAPATGSPPATRPGNVVSGPLGTTQSSEFQLAAGVAEVVVRASDTGADLYRAATPEGSGFVPVVTAEGAQVRLQLAKTGDGEGRATVTIDLNARVRWQVSMVGGSESATVDMRGASLAGVDFIGGVARIDLWLPKPQGVLPIRMSGGAREFAIHAPDRIPVRVRLARGAAEVTVDGSKRSGVASGTRITQPAWERTPDRYDVDAIAGLAVLTVDRY